MVTERYVVLGLATVGSRWFRELSRWATTAVVPIDFVKCVSITELNARLAAGPTYSAVLVDAALPGLDRDLVDAARESGAAALVVHDGSTQRNWIDLGAAAVLPHDFDRDDLLAALDLHAPRIAPRSSAPSPQVSPSEGWRGSLVAICGPPGAGASVIAMAIAQGLAADPRNRTLVALADLRLDADMALYHDARDVVPGLQELVEAHRTGSLGTTELRRLLFAVDDRGYDLLLGLRRHRDWTALRPRAVDSAVDTLLTNYRYVIADVDSDFEGEEATGSVEVEERNVLARTTIRHAALVVTVASADLRGLHRLTRLTRDLDDVGVPRADRLTIVNRAPRSPRIRAEITRTIADTTQGDDTTTGAPTVFVPERRRLSELLRDGAPLPPGMCRELAVAVAAMCGDQQRRAPVQDAPAVHPGSLGSWPEQDLVS